MKIEFDSIMLEFGMHRVLSAIHMACNTREVVGLLGRNGSGKSCLMRIVFGSMAAQSKSVRIDGQYLTGNYMHKKRIAYLPQHDLLPEFLTFSSALNLFGVKADQIKNAFPELMDILKRSHIRYREGNAEFLKPYSYFIQITHFVFGRTIFGCNASARRTIIGNNLFREIPKRNYCFRSSS